MSRKVWADSALPRWLRRQDPLTIFIANAFIALIAYLVVVIGMTVGSVPLEAVAVIIQASALIITCAVLAWVVKHRE
jgi:hypothetical protein